MAHNLNYNEHTQKYSYFSVKEKAWHGLGQILSGYPNSAEAIVHAGLNYIVEKRPLFTVNNSHADPTDPQCGTAEATIAVPNYYATIRTDTEQVLGVVGKDYQVVENKDAFSFFDSIVGAETGILYETAGALGNGERIFITAKLPDYIKVGRDDLIEQYLFLTTSHDGCGSITAAFTPIRIVCQNTLNAAIRSKQNAFKIRHTSSAVDRLKQAHQLMGITHQMAFDMEQIFNHWAKIRITDTELHRLISQAMAPSKEVLLSLNEEKHHELSSHFIGIINDAYEYALSAPSQLQTTTKGTLFGAYNAVTGYFQNVRRFSDDSHKLKSIINGTARQRAQSAFDLCLTFEN